MRVVKRAIATRNEELLNMVCRKYPSELPQRTWIYFLPLVLKWKWKALAERLLSTAMQQEREKENEKGERNTKDEKPLTATLVGMKALMWAATYGWIDIAERLVALGVSYVAYNKVTRTHFKRVHPLMSAVHAGQVAMVRWLLQQDGIVVDETDWVGGRPIMTALRCPVVEARAPMTLLLLDAGACATSQPLLHCALKTEFWNVRNDEVREEEDEVIEVVTRILRKGGEIDAEGMRLAVENGCIRLVELFVREGASVNEPDHNGITPLMVAAERGHKQMASALLRMGADVALQDRLGYSAAGFAIYNGNLDMVQCLIDQSHQISSAELQKCLLSTFLELRQADFPLAIPLMKLLLAAGLDINNIQETPSVLTSLLAWRETATNPQIAATYHQLFELLLENGMNPNVTDEKGNTILHLLFDYDCTDELPWETIELLIHKGANADAVNGSGQTPMSLASGKTLHRLKGFRRTNKK